MEALKLIEDIYRTRYSYLSFDQVTESEKLLGIKSMEKEIVKYPFTDFNTDKFVSNNCDVGHLKEIDGKWFFYGDNFLRVVKEDDEFEVLF